MRRYFIFLIWFSTCYASYNIDDLPWIKAEDREAIKYAVPFLPANPVILEAGVCDGEDTNRMLQQWPNAKIYGFEPLPQHYKLSEKNIFDKSRVRLYPCALFDRVGSLIFYESHKVPGASSILQDNLDNIEIPQDIPHDGVNYLDQSITIKCTTIDQWAKENNIDHIDYLWLDTEGTELTILKHAKTILPTVKVISIEADFKEFRKGMPLFSELYEFLIQQGFIVKYIWGRPDWQAVAIFVNSRFYSVTN